MSGPLRTRIEQGVQLAPVMVRCAMERLRAYQACMVDGAPTPGFEAENLAEVGDGLRKYFEIDSVVEAGHSLPGFLRGLLAVYRAVADGLESQHDVIFYPEREGDTAKGKTALDGVVRSGRDSASFPRLAFGFVDEYGHSDWQGFTGGILMSQEYFAKSITPAEWLPGEEIARVLVHEGTHRWAQTKDINYKHNSAAWRLQAEEAKVADDGARRATFGNHLWGKLDAKSRDEKLAYHKKTFIDPRRAAADQNVVLDRGPGHKPLRSLNVAGVVDPSRQRAGAAIDPLRWIENADSYSWFARRMWKRSGRPQK